MTMSAACAVTSTEGMTADWHPFEHDFLTRVSSRIVNQVRGVNRVVYDVTSKPPGLLSGSEPNGSNPMIRFLPALILIAAAAPAVARGPAFVGNWAINAKACKERDHDGRLALSLRTARFHESSCKISKVARGRWPGIYYVTSSCAGEGQKWTRRDVYAVRGKGKRLVIVDQDGFALTYVRCR